MNEQWERWRGSVDEKMQNHSNKIEDHCDRLTEVEDKLGMVLVKLAVPVFLSSIFGVVIGGIIVWAITRGAH